MNPSEIYKSNPEFKNRTKHLFLSAAHQKFGRIKSATPSAFKYFIRGAASGVALMLLLAGAATYADQKNVGAENILYPLKRSQEAIKVAFTKHEEKPALHLKLAKRRLEEIKEVKSKDPQSPKVASLVADLKNEVKNSFETIQGDGGENPSPLKTISQTATLAATTSFTESASQQIFASQKIEDSNPDNQSSSPRRSENEKETGDESSDRKNLTVCESWSDIIGDKDNSVEEVVSENPDLISHFNNKCQTILENFNQNQKNNNSHKKDSGDDSKRNNQEKSD